MPTTTPQPCGDPQAPILLHGLAPRALSLLAGLALGACVTPVAVEDGQLHLGLFQRSSERPTDFAHATELRGVGLTVGDRGLGLGWLSHKRLAVDADRAEGKLETDWVEAYFGEAAVAAAGDPTLGFLTTPPAHD